jgi:insertion element IS1 protein InsB
VTLVDRATRCIVNWAVVPERTVRLLQGLVDTAPAARAYFRDAYAPYDQVHYHHGTHTSLPNKSQTDSVEGGNADLRHYLARLVRKSRCFSRCIHALRRAVKLFVYAYNRRQLHKRRYPRYPAHVCTFAAVGN